MCAALFTGLVVKYGRADSEDIYINRNTEYNNSLIVIAEIIL
jgi:hypothetical protein